MTKTMCNRILGMLAVAVVFTLVWLAATQSRGAAAAGNADYIEGVVASSKGPEAGVWVIAETTELPTKYAKVVVTDDQGRYVLPELPMATYQVFVRGYGLVDSARVPAKPGQHLNLKAVVAPDGRAAAQIYPANYWLSLAKIPSGKLSPYEVAGRIKACMNCHQIGDQATREIPAVTKNLGPFKSSSEAWDRRVKSGPVGANMASAYLLSGSSARFLQIGPIALPRASTQRMPRLVRAASSAISYSRCGTGEHRPITCTTKPPATYAIPRSIRMDLCTAWSPAATSSFG
jgi:hypothetical protein